MTLCGLGVFFTLNQGKKLESPQIQVLTQNSKPNPAHNLKSLAHKTEKPTLSLLLFQVILIVVLAHGCGTLFERLGQPSVVGEMVAGILLGPSLIGQYFPGFFNFLFPDYSMEILKMLSQVGVLLFMFVIGLELDPNQLRRNISSALLISHSGIVIPFLIGCLVALPLYSEYVSSQTSFTAFALFLGVSMSITAFPVLARILEERGLTRTFLGTTAITSAALDDITAWCLLALVIAVAGAQGFINAAGTLFFTVLYMAIMLLVVRPLLRKIIEKVPEEHLEGKGALATVFLLLFCSALLTEVIGIHALFGAFMAGFVLPQNIIFKNFLRARLEHFSSVFLLPLFFAFTGLRTQIGLLENLHDFLIALMVIAAAVLGKFGGTFLASKVAGINWKEASALGILMNTRGLMELIVLNIGYDMGILPPKIFSIMVLMALATTFMAGPLLSLLRVSKNYSSL